MTASTSPARSTSIASRSRGFLGRCSSGTQGHLPLAGDVGEAQLVDIISSEVPFDEVVVTGRAGALPVLALLDPGGGVPLVVAADPPRGASAHRFSGLRSFVCQQPAAESTVVAVGVRQHVGSIRLDDLSLGDLPTPPAVVGLAGELQDPQGTLTEMASAASSLKSG